MLTKTPGKRYAYRYNFHALKRACEAQQNPLPSDTKEDKLHAIMQTAISDEVSVQSPASSGSREEFSLPSLASPAYTECGETSSQARSPPPPYPHHLHHQQSHPHTFNYSEGEGYFSPYQGQTDNSEEYLSPYQGNNDTDSSYDYSDLYEEDPSLPSSDLVEALVSQSSTSSLSFYEELSPGSWATTGLHYSASSVSASSDIEEFNLTFLDRPASQ